MIPDVRCDVFDVGRLRLIPVACIYPYFHDSSCAVYGFTIVSDGRRFDARPDVVGANNVCQCSTESRINPL